MKNNISINRWSIRLLGFLCCVILVGKADLWAAKPHRQVDTTKLFRMAAWKERPHSIQLNLGTGYSIFYSYNHKPWARFALDYNFDLPWKHIRTNFFVVGNIAYEGNLYNNRQHRSVDRFHISAGVGYNIHLTHYLNLSFLYAPGFLYENRVQCSDETVSTGNHWYKHWEITYAYCALFAIRLTGEVKNVRIGIGLENPHYLFFLNPNFYVSLNVGYRF